MIAFNKFTTQVTGIRAELDAAINRVLNSGWFILGPEVEAFESELADYLGIPHVVAVNSGTDAVSLALTALEIGPGAEVCTTDMTAFPTISAICRTGATPVVCDIDYRSGLLDPSQIEEQISARTKAIVPVHLYGQCCDMTTISTLAAKHNLRVVEDCAQAIGAQWQGQVAGSFGDAAALSFYPTKNLGALGDGGAVVTTDAAIANRVRQLRNYGQTQRYHHAEPGCNSRLDEIQAAILRVKLKHLDAWTRRRQAIAAVYRERLPTENQLTIQTEAAPVYHLFPILVENRDHFVKQMLERQIQTLIHYPVPIHEQPGFPGKAGAGCPNTTAFAAHVVSLPIAPELTDDEVDQIWRHAVELAGQ